MITLEKAASILLRSLAPSRPYHVQWFLTRRCNFRCKGCNVWRDKAHGRELTTEEVKAGLAVLRKLGVAEVVFSGGNPLLRDDIDEILACASKDFITTVYDNGSTALKKMEALRYADFTAISLDALDPVKNDYIRGVPGAWKTAVDAAMKLNENGLAAAVSTTISQINLNEVKDFTEHFTSHGIPVLYSLYSYDNPDEAKSFTIGGKNSEFDITDVKAAADLFSDLARLKRGRDGILITDKALQAMKELFLNNRRTWTCKALQNFFVIDNHGRVAGCHLKKPITSILELPQVWHSAEFDKLRKEYQKCRGCTYLCYMFYSLHSNLRGSLGLVSDQRRNMANYLMKLRKNRKHIA